MGKRVKEERVTNPYAAGIWVKCPNGCENWWCQRHRQHVYECPCPPIEEWDQAGMVEEAVQAGKRALPDGTPIVPVEVNQPVIGQEVADLPTALHLLARMSGMTFMSIMQHAPEDVREQTRRDIAEFRELLDRWTASLGTPKLRS